MRFMESLVVYFLQHGKLLRDKICVNVIQDSLR